MIDEILAEIFDDAVLGDLNRSRRAQLVARMFFGLLGTGLALAGAVYFALEPGPTTNGPMRLSMIAVFVFLGCFCLFNVMLARPWRWPGRWFLISFAALFATRILFGA